MLNVRQVLRFLKLNDVDVLDLMGLQRRRSVEGAWLAGVGTFGAGLLVGSGVALLLAPKTGRELRANLARAAKRATGAAKRASGEIKGEIKERYETLRERARENKDDDIGFEGIDVDGDEYRSGGR